MTRAWRRVVSALCIALMTVQQATAFASPHGAAARAVVSHAGDADIHLTQGRGNSYTPPPAYRAPSYSPPAYRAPTPAPAFRQPTVPTYRPAQPVQRPATTQPRIAPVAPSGPSPYARPFVPPLRAGNPVAGPNSRFGIGAVQVGARSTGGYISRFGASSALTAPALAIRRNANVTNVVASRIASVGIAGRTTSAFNRAASASPTAASSQAARRIAAIGAGAAAVALVARAPTKAANDNSYSSNGGGGSKPPPNAKSPPRAQPEYLVLATGNRTLVGQFLGSGNPRGNLGGGTVGLRQRQEFLSQTAVHKSMKLLQERIAGMKHLVANDKEHTASKTSQSDDWHLLSGMLRTAAAGKGDHTVGFAKREQAKAAGEAWVGPNAKTASDGRTLVSEDGLRQFRPPSGKPRAGLLAPTRIQANLQSRSRINDSWTNNAHIDIAD
ncbi:hypothetical protein SAMN04488115_11440 [Bosea lathyri]|uniref:Uncharacterized protein n=1 Tax=Bosea lathyri TaxID=1036778 RepID=A0A1H6D2X1_9HYPH|nr:hypothetical protein SAMN04488115_11440 [Bosea lathyri]